MQDFSGINTNHRIDKLEERIFSHFQQEEEILSDDDYPHVAQHRRIHNQIRKWMYEKMRASRSVAQ
jgi:hemerythrin